MAFWTKGFCGIAAFEFGQSEIEKIIQTIKTLAKKAGKKKQPVVAKLKNQ